MVRPAWLAVQRSVRGVRELKTPRAQGAVRREQPHRTWNSLSAEDETSKWPTWTSHTDGSLRFLGADTHTHKDPASAGWTVRVAMYVHAEPLTAWQLQIRSSVFVTL